MEQSLRAAISRGWPSQPMAIQADNVYRQSAAAVHDPAQLFEKAKIWIAAIHSRAHDEDVNQVILKVIHEAMVRAIYGSNQIERAGLNWDLTVELCRQVLTDETVDDLDQTGLLDLYSKQPGLESMPSQYVVSSRKEVVQHARAFQHLIHSFVVEKKRLTEDLIRETHRILVTGVPIDQDDEVGPFHISPEEYGGIYRECHIHAGVTNFTSPRFVAKQMKNLCDDLEQELATAERDGAIDPFSVASKYSLEFVHIHPFRDGNGRMCRMILNAILCRYAGIVVPIGEQEEERREYMAIKKRSTAEMEGHGEYATFVLQRAITRLREMKKKLAGKRRGSP